MGYDPEPPTRKLPPQPPAGAPAERVSETEYVADDGLRHEQLLDKVRSLQTALALVGVLAAAALGVALWTLLSEDEESGGRGASSERVSQLQSDVERLEERIENRATENSVSELRSDVSDLEGKVESATSGESGGEEAQQAVEDVRGDVEQLQQRVDDLAERAAAAPDAEGTTTGP